MNIDNWLQGLGLGQYAEQFRSNDVDSETLRRLSSDDLKEIGVASVGHRKKLLEAIGALNVASETFASETIASETIAPETAAGRGRASGTAAAPVAAGAERRQLTVMFVDLVGSSALASRLDPEDLQQLIRNYHEAVGAAVAPYEGHIAQFLGDGVLVYFGYPRAHEDDAARAVRSGLSIVKAIQTRHARDQIALQIRIGIATGLVVVGEIGVGTAAAERSASGETPNLAARLQAQAKPGEILLSEETRHLIGDSFTLESVGALELKGFAASVPAWQVLGERTVATRFEAQHMQGLVRFIGRDSEVALLMERWALAQDGEGQAVLLSGEAGIGKSRICQTLRERLAGESVATVFLQCSPYFSSSALYPVVQHLERTAGMAPAEAPEVRAHKLEQLAGALPEDYVGCLLRLMGLPDGGRSLPGGGSPQEEKARTLEALNQMLQRLSEREPVLFLVEDAHWIDPTTEELIGQLAQQIRGARVLLLVTCRPEYVPSWGGAAPLTRLSVNRLSHKQCAALVSAVTAGKALPADVLAQIIGKTDGIPLFVEELTKTVVQSGLLEDTPSGYQLRGPMSTLAIPATLQDSLMARLDRLAPAKEVAQVGAAIGREFGHRLIAQVLSTMAPTKLGAALADLVRSELVFRRGTPPDAVYTFKHAMVRDTAYNSMLKSQRVLWHQQIAAALEQAERDAVATQPELLAHHHQEGGNPAGALRYWLAAGDQAMARSAIREAVTHYESAVALLNRVRPIEQARDRLELGLRLKLGRALLQTEGFTSDRAHENFTKARDLAALLDLPEERVQSSAAVAVYLGAAGRIREAIALLAQFGAAELARVQPVFRSVRLHCLGFHTMLCGESTEAGHLLAEAARYDEPAEIGLPSGTDRLAAIHHHLSANLALQGRLESGEASAQMALEIAERAQHANSRVLTLVGAAYLSLLKEDFREMVERCQTALDVAGRYGLRTYTALGSFYIGTALVKQGQLKEGIRLCREGYVEWERFSGRFFSTSLASIAAGMLLEAGCRDEATEFILAGEKTQDETDERWQVAELLRLRARLAELDGDRTGAESGYRRAIEIAERQGALLQALRAATALATLCASQDRAGEANIVLRSIYDRFVEGFDWPDLVRARAVLERGK